MVSYYQKPSPVEMDIDMHASLISCILMDVRDRTFLSGVKAYIDKLPPERLSQDLACTNTLIVTILSQNIMERKETIIEFLKLPYSDNIKSRVIPDARYTKDYKTNLLKSLEYTVIYDQIIEPTKNLESIVNKIRMSNYTSKAQVYDEFKDAINLLYKTVNEQDIAVEDDGLLILDPISKTTHNTLADTIDVMKLSLHNKVKTIPLFDNMFTGGLIPGTLSIFGALAGNFKSGMLHNLALYASKNNSPDAFIHEPELVPCILMMSLELSRRQLLLRDLSFMGMHLSKQQIDSLLVSEIEDLVMRKREDLGFQIPIVYSERLTAQKPTNISMIENLITKLRNKGLQTVMLAVDYLDLMQVQSFSHQHMNTTGADGAKVLQQKAKELRDICMKLNLVGLTAAQLNAEASRALLKCQGHLSKVDIISHYNESMFASSTAISRECEVIVLLHKVTITETDQTSKQIIPKDYISLGVFKDRDSIVGPYVKSMRDIETEHEYETYTTKLKQDLNLRPLILETGKFQAVIPLDGYKLSETDYAHSIRNFYPNDNAISLNEILTSATSKGSGIMEDQDIFDTTFDQDISAPINM